MKLHYKNTSLIILAGGKSQRAETLKGLRLFEGKYWLDVQLQFFKNIGFQKIYVGLGFNHQEYITKSVELSESTAVINPNPENGSFSTLQCVLNLALQSNWDNLLLLHIDHALPQIKTLELLLKNSHCDVIKPVYNNKSGHPILLSRGLCQILMHQPNSSQLNKEIQKLRLEQIMWVEVDDIYIHENLNTQDKWQIYKRALRNS